MEKRKENNMRKYFVLSSITGIVSISLWIAICFAIPIGIGTFFSLLFILLLTKLIIRIIANKTIASVLFKDLNAQQFQQILNSSKHLIPPLSYRINAAFFTGDYQTVVNIASCQMQKKRCSIKEKFLYLTILARAYFELRDFEKLNIILNKYDVIKELYPSKKFINTTNSAFSYYSYFLDGNFEACKTICRERISGLNSKAWDAKIIKLNNDFFYAVACYENGDIDDATECFNSIISYAPNMHSAELSARYVDAIKTNSKITLFSEIVPEKDYHLYDDRTAKHLRRNRIITTILLILFCFSIIASSVLDWIQDQQISNYKSELAEYENDLNSAISKYYDNAKFIKYFDVRNGEQYIDALCLIEFQGRFNLASFVTKDGGETTDLVFLIEDIQIPHDYSVKSAVSNNMITLFISDEQISGSDCKDIIEFSYNNTDYWIGIKDITPLT